MKKIVVSGLKTAMLERAVVKNADTGPGASDNPAVMMKKNTGRAVVRSGQIA